MKSQGNVDRKLYASVPDSQLKITEKGQQQAYVSDYHLEGILVTPFLPHRQLVSD